MQQCSTVNMQMCSTVSEQQCSTGELSNLVFYLHSVEHWFPKLQIKCPCSQWANRSAKQCKTDSAQQWTRESVRLWTSKSARRSRCKSAPTCHSRSVQLCRSNSARQCPASSATWLGSLSERKNGIMWEKFPNWGGGSDPNPLHIFYCFFQFRSL